MQLRHHGPPAEIAPFCRRLLALPNVILAANVANVPVLIATGRL